MRKVGEESAARFRLVYYDSQGSRVIDAAKALHENEEVPQVWTTPAALRSRGEKFLVPPLVRVLSDRRFYVGARYPR